MSIRQWFYLVLALAFAAFAVYYLVSGDLVRMDINVLGFWLAGLSMRVLP